MTSLEFRDRLMHGANIGPFPIIGDEMLPWIEHMVWGGARLNDKHPSGGGTVLHDVADTWHLSRWIEPLILAGASTGITNDKGDIPLMTALRRSITPCVHELIRCSPGLPDVRLSNGETLLHAVAKSALNDDGAALGMLLEAGVDPRVSSETEWTAAHCAVNNVGYLRALHAAGADLNAIGGHAKVAPLHLAAEGGRVDAFAFMLTVGIDMDAKNGEGKSVWDLALKPGSKVRDIALAARAGKAAQQAVAELREGLGPLPQALFYRVPRIGTWMS